MRPGVGDQERRAETGGCVGSSGRYAPPAIHTASMRRTISADRSMQTATTVSGPTPAARSAPARRGRARRARVGQLPAGALDARRGPGWPRTCRSNSSWTQAGRRGPAGGSAPGRQHLRRASSGESIGASETRSSGSRTNASQQVLIVGHHPADGLAPETARCCTPPGPAARRRTRSGRTRGRGWPSPSRRGSRPRTGPACGPGRRPR